MSVVIPTRDRWQLLSRTLDCARRQEGVGVEIVVVDDGSADGTAERVGRLGDPRIQTVRHPQSLGLSKARNAGIRRAAGEWIAFLDDDDLWSPQKLLRQLDAARRAEAAWCYSAAAFVDSQGRVEQVREAPAPESVLLRLRGVNLIPAGASNVIVRANLLDGVGHFDEAFRHFADWDLWIRLATAARAATVDEPLVAYVQHRGNLRFKEPEMLMSELDRLDAKHGLAGDSEPGRLGILRWIGDAQWRCGHRDAAVRTFARLVRSRRAVPNLVWVAKTVRPRRRHRPRSLERELGLGPIEWLERHRAASADPFAGRDPT